MTTHRSNALGATLRHRDRLPYHPLDPSPGHQRARVPGHLHPHPRSGAGARERHPHYTFTFPEGDTVTEWAEKWRQEYLAEGWIRGTW